jgi:hypothetical protein
VIGIIVFRIAHQTQGDQNKPDHDYHRGDDGQGANGEFNQI